MVFGDGMLCGNAAFNRMNGSKLLKKELHYVETVMDNFNDEFCGGNDYAGYNNYGNCYNNFGGNECGPCGGPVGCGPCGGPVECGPCGGPVGCGPCGGPVGCDPNGYINPNHFDNKSERCKKYYN